MEEALAEAALTASHHLACVSGPDRGAVVALEEGKEFGRATTGSIDPALSRRHCSIRIHPGPGRRVATLEDLGATNPLKRTRSLRAGSYVRLGSGWWRVRGRPEDLHWPAPRPPNNRTLVRPWLRFLPLVMLTAMVWRFAPADRAILTGALAGAVAFSLAVWRLWKEVRRRRFDPAFLRLALAARPASRATEPFGPGFTPVSVWTRGVGTRPLHIRGDVGIIGPGSCAYARWLAAQIWLEHPDLRWVEGQLVDPRAPTLWIRGPTDDGTVPAGSITVAWGREVSFLPPHIPQIVTATRMVGRAWLQDFGDNTHENTEELPAVVTLDLNTTTEATAARWHAFAEGAGSWAVPVGAHWDAAERRTVPFVLDLTENGPHALLAGGTGSGKSIALQTWLWSLALHIPPTRLRLVLVDYKGGAGLGPLSALPHVEKMETDLEAGGTSWLLRRLNGVMLARKRDLLDAGFADVSLWERESLGSAPPRLVVVIDEFQALSEEHPGQINALCRLAAQGRSLGLHLILATQRPGPAITPELRGVLDLRIALRCAEKTDSIAVRGDDRAQRLPRIPGRALYEDAEFHFALLDPAPNPAALPEWGNSDPLWPKPLPKRLDFSQLPNPKAIGVYESPDSTGPLLPAAIPGRALLFVGPASARAELVENAVNLGIHVAQTQKRPVVVIGHPGQVVLDPVQTIPTADVGRIARTLTHMADSDSVAVIFTDFPGVVREFEGRALDAEFGALWNRLTSPAAGAGPAIFAVDVEGTARGRRISAQLVKIPTLSAWSEPSLIRLIPQVSLANGGLQAVREEAVSEVPGRFLGVGLSSLAGPAGNSKPLPPTVIQLAGGTPPAVVRTVFIDWLDPPGLKDAISAEVGPNTGINLLGATDEITEYLRGVFPQATLWSHPKEHWMKVAQDRDHVLVAIRPPLELVRFLANLHPEHSLWLKASFPCKSASGVVLGSAGPTPFGAAPDRLRAKNN